MPPTKKVTKGSAQENIVLVVARSDYDDDNDGASFMLPEQRTWARKLAASGHLKIVSDEKNEVIAKLTAKGLKLLEARRELAAERRARAPRAEGDSPLHDYRIEFQSQKQHERNPDAWSTHRETYKSRENAEAHAGRIATSEPGMRVRVV